MAAGPPPPSRVLDLGSGGGLPGLPLALSWLATEVVLLDSNKRKAVFLSGAVERLGLEDRVRVVEMRSEDFARGPENRGTYPLVVARSFGAPAVVAECAAPFLERGGRLIVSTPSSGAETRWDSVGLGKLGMEVGPLVVTSKGSYQVVIQSMDCPDRFPRRTGVAGHRPLFKA